MKVDKLRMLSRMTHIIYACLISLSVALGQSLDLEPIVFSMVRSTGDWWQPDARPVSYSGAGIRGVYKKGNLEISSEFVNTRFSGLTQFPSRFTPEEALSSKAHATFQEDEFDSDYTNMLIKYRFRDLQVLAGKYHLNWGIAENNILGSSKAPTVPRFGFDWQILDWLNFKYDHAKLNSGLIDTLLSEASPTRYRGREIIRNRYFVTHRLEITFPFGLVLAGSESVVYGDRSLEMVYLLPFLSYWSAQHFLGDLDNTWISLEASLQIRSGVTVYGIFLMDEWRPQWTFQDNNRNWFGWEYGLLARDLVRTGDQLRIEGTWTDHRIYRHGFPVNDYYSHGNPVGHWTGPHAQSLSLGYHLPVGKGFVSTRYFLAKRGELTEQMVRDQYASVPYSRFSGNMETLRSTRLALYWPTLRDTWLEISVTNNDWMNAGFDPFNPSAQTSGDIQKWSLNFGVYHNFSLNGYDASFLFQDNILGSSHGAEPER